MNYRFIDLVDIDEFQSMLQSLYEATGILHGLVDDQNNVISAIGWQDACVKFHRASRISNERCLASNRYLAEHVGTEGYIGCKCQNGLMDYATPVVVDGRLLATLYFGQCLHEPPDMEFFRRQAQQCGFDEEAYLESIRKLPVIPEARVKSIMSFYGQLAQMLARSGLDRLRQRKAESSLEKLNRDLSHRVEERTAELTARNEQLAAEAAERQRTADALHTSQMQFQAILDSSPIGIGWTRHGKVEYVNRKFTEMYGYCLDDIPMVEDWYRLAYPDESLRSGVVGKWIRDVEDAKSSGLDAPRLEVPIVCKDGSVRYAIISASWIGDRRLVNFSDITARWLAEQRDQMHSSILGLIAKGAPLEQTLESLVRSVESEDKTALCSILLISEDEKHLHLGAAPSLPAFYNDAIDGVEIGPNVGSCGTAASTGQRVVVTDIQTHPYWANFKNLAHQAGLASCWSEPVFSSKGRLLGTFAIYHHESSSPNESDIRRITRAANLASIAIERNHVQIELERQATTDFLTGLASRRYFMERALGGLAHAKRYGEPFSMLMVDIDYFKRINDSHGHKSGDLVLQSVARIMQHTMREVDSVGRIGGEEFAITLPNTDKDAACLAAKRLLLAISGAEMATEAGELLHLTVSIGVATSSDAQCDVEQLLKKADQALYAAKRNGRNQVHVADA
ncbi:MAG TPA: diguanylate cyclase [Rhodocyclaceae bacterium]|nr:diguanylate cyclase [Rhodocyclaceae bacterium]